MRKTRVEPPILGFHGEFEFLSNFYPCRIFYENVWYESSEHAYQAAKTTNKYDLAYVAVQPTPAKAKMIVKNLPHRSDWSDSLKLQIMEDILRIKFAIPKLRLKLLATKDAYLEETNYWNDRFWGVCNSSGFNHLGEILMKIRDK